MTTFPADILRLVALFSPNIRNMRFVCKEWNDIFLEDFHISLHILTTQYRNSYHIIDNREKYSTIYTCMRKTMKSSNKDIYHTIAHICAYSENIPISWDLLAYDCIRYPQYVSALEHTWSSYGKEIFTLGYWRYHKKHHPEYSFSRKYPWKSNWEYNVIDRITSVMCIPRKRILPCIMGGFGYWVEDEDNEKLGEYLDDCMVSLEDFGDHAIGYTTWTVVFCYSYLLLPKVRKLIDDGKFPDGKDKLTLFSKIVHDGIIEGKKLTCSKEHLFCCPWIFPFIPLFLDLDTVLKLDRVDLLDFLLSKERISIGSIKESEHLWGKYVRKYMNSL